MLLALEFVLYLQRTVRNHYQYAFFSCCSLPPRPPSGRCPDPSVGTVWWCKFLHVDHGFQILTTLQVNFNGNRNCVSGSYCRFQNDYYSQCVPGTDPNQGGQPQQPTTTTQQQQPTSTPTTTSPTTVPTAAPVGEWVIPPAQAGGLHEKMRTNKNNRYFGTCFDRSHLTNNNLMTIAKNEFGVVTHENSLKWDATERMFLPSFRVLE